jgi:hypothetical protein
MPTYHGRCESCGVRVEANFLIDTVSFLFESVVVFFLLLLFIRELEYIGVVISLSIWLLLDLLRAFCVPLSIKKS